MARTDEVVTLSLACGNMSRYLYDKDYQQEMDERAQDATDGNITAFEILVRELRAALEPFKDA